MIKLFYHNHASYKTRRFDIKDHPFYLLNENRNIDLITKCELLESHFKECENIQIYKLILQIKEK